MFLVTFQNFWKQIFCFCLPNSSFTLQGWIFHTIPLWEYFCIQQWWILLFFINQTFYWFLRYMQIFQFQIDLENMLYRYYTVIYSILTRCIMSINIVFPRGAQVIYAPTLHIAWGRFQYALWINYFQGFSRISVISSSCMILSNNVHSMALNIYHFLIENANKISNK